MDPTARTMRVITTCDGGDGTDWNVIQNWSGTYGGDVIIGSTPVRPINGFVPMEWG